MKGCGASEVEACSTVFSKNPPRGLITEEIPHMIPEDIQYCSQACGKLQNLCYWKGTYLSGLVKKKGVGFFLN